MRVCPSPQSTRGCNQLITKHRAEYSSTTESERSITLIVIIIIMTAREISVRSVTDRNILTAEILVSRFQSSTRAVLLSHKLTDRWTDRLTAVVRLQQRPTALRNRSPALPPSPSHAFSFSCMFETEVRSCGSNPCWKQCFRNSDLPYSAQGFFFFFWGELLIPCCTRARSPSSWKTSSECLLVPDEFFFCMIPPHPFSTFFPLVLSVSSYPG